MMKLILLVAIGVAAAFAAEAPKTAGPVVPFDPFARNNLNNDPYYRNNYNNNPYYRNDYNRYDYNRYDYNRYDPYNRNYNTYNRYDPYSQFNRNDARYNNRYDDGRYNNKYDDGSYNANNYKNNVDYYKQYNNNNQYKQYPAGAEAGARILSYSSNLNPDGSYEYSYNTDNGISAAESGVSTAFNAEEGTQTAQGYFAYTSPEGVPVNVRYIADENGFRPEGDVLPKNAGYVAQAGYAAEPLARAKVVPQTYSKVAPSSFAPAA